MPESAVCSPSSLHLRAVLCTLQLGKAINGRVCPSTLRPLSVFGVGFLQAFLWKWPLQWPHRAAASETKHLSGLVTPHHGAC